MKRLVFYTKSDIESSRCRGTDIANYLDMPINIPLDEVASEDISILVKKFDRNIIAKSKHTYIDFMDGHDGLEQEIADNIHGLENKISILTMDPHGAKILKKYVFPQYPVVWIPHTHCNNEERIRPLDREVKTILYNGNEMGFADPLWKVFSENAQRHNFITIKEQTVSVGSSDDRKLCSDSYYNADIAVSFRMYGGRYLARHHPEIPITSIDLKCATKLNNASSFKVPSVAFPEHAFLWNYTKNGTFIPVYDLRDMLRSCICLRDDPKLYQLIADKAYEESKPYHIKYVSQKYLDLLKDA